MGQGIRTALVAGALTLLLASQALASSAMPPDRVATGKLAGQAAFAYLGGLRIFAAAVLWNRIEPQFHDYYGGQTFAEQEFMVPTLAMVQTLDPQFTQAYYLSSYMIARRGDSDLGIEIARDGIRNNPQSGLLHMNLTQLLYLQDRNANLDELVEISKAGLGDDIQWDGGEELFEAYAVFRDVFRVAGDDRYVTRLDEELDALREQGVGLGDHDHDGDGIQDH